ncbi:MAG TPA: ABC transporter permease [Candidatus Binatia bacterium]|jgi:peptide/nickel transport system permease protein|nr:ABC transporter permease [Candidatus Binatia bacterium]
MFGYLIQRLLLMIPTFIGITLIGFLIMRLAPGDPAELRAAGGLGAAAGAGISTEKRGAVDEAMAQWRAQYGLDRPLHVQYWVWLKNLATLSFGESFKDSQSVWAKISERVPVTVTLNVWSLIVVYLVAIPLGIYSATHPNSLGDKVTTLAAFILFAVPLVWAATMAIVFICGGDFYYLFPPGGLESLEFSESWSIWKKFKDHAWHIFLPVVLLSYDGFAGLSRYMRSSMLEVLGQDYVQVARAKGLPERIVILKHVLRNSLIPQVTILASILPALIGGSVIIETIFSIPGLGQLGFESVLARDYPTVLALFTVSAVLTLIGILLSDFLLAAVDPRIVFGRRQQ